MKYIFSALLIFCSLSTFTQSTNSILWEDEFLLSWSDFQGHPDENHPMKAMTAAGASVQRKGERSGNKVTIHYTVCTVFSPKKSWVKDDEPSDALLAHEQLHFDIAELFTRKLRKRIQTFAFTANFQEEYKEIYQKINQERNDYQILYDKVTDHSRNKEAQVEWVQKVTTEIQSLSDYSEEEFTISFTIQ